MEFAKAHEAQLSVRGAVVDGQLLDASRVEALASLPPVSVLRAQVIATVESPIAELIGTIEQLIGEVAWIIEQASATRESSPRPPEATAGPSTPEQQAASA